MEAGLIISRFLHYFGVVLAFGVALFPFYCLRTNEPAPRVIQRSTSLIIACAALLAIASGVAWFIFTVNAMADSPTGFLDRDTVHYVTSDTEFGKLWVGRAVVAVVLMIFSIARAVQGRAGRSPVAVALSGILLMTLAGTGHTQTSMGVTKFVQVGSDSVHLLSAGAWLGGLVPLAIITARGTGVEAEAALSRFSGMGYVAVAALFASGVVDGVILVGSFGGLFGTGYGQLLLVKVGLFLTMVALAGANRFLLVPSLGNESKRGNALAHLRGHILLEQILGIAVLAIVGALGTIEPPAMPT